MPVLAVTLFCIFLIIAIFNTFVSTKHYEGEIMQNDITRLADALMQIERDCKIISLESQKNSINFLNVKSFAGSQVGPINLKHPDRWRGPYLDVNPSMQSIEYLLVRTQKGYFVTPGEGVKLPNGKIMGKDIKLDENADIEAMMKDEKLLGYKGKALAAPLTIKKRDPYFIPHSVSNYSL
jgi:hypothetical protein